MLVNSVNNVENQNRISTSKSALLGGAVGAIGAGLFAAGAAIYNKIRS